MDVNKMAIAWTIGIVAVAAGFASVGEQAKLEAPSITMPETPSVSLPTPKVIPEEPTPTDPFAEEAAKIREQTGQ